MSRCPQCSRPGRCIYTVAGNVGTKRRRECTEGHRWNTWEITISTLPTEAEAMDGLLSELEKRLGGLEKKLRTIRNSSLNGGAAPPDPRHERSHIRD